MLEFFENVFIVGVLYVLNWVERWVQAGAGLVEILSENRYAMLVLSTAFLAANVPQGFGEDEGGAEGAELTYGGWDSDEDEEDISVVSEAVEDEPVDDDYVAIAPPSSPVRQGNAWEDD